MTSLLNLLAAAKVREEFLDHIRGIAKYWANESRAQTPQEKCDGVAFSILTMLDGCAGMMPAFDVSVSLSEEDRKYYQKEKENWYENGMVINNDVHLHELYYKEQQ